MCKYKSFSTSTGIMNEMFEKLMLIQFTNKFRKETALYYLFNDDNFLFNKDMKFFLPYCCIVLTILNTFLSIQIFCVENIIHFLVTYHHLVFTKKRLSKI